MILIVNSPLQPLRRGFASTAMLACALLLAGCGQTGPLYLPQKPAPRNAGQSVQPLPADESTPPVATPPVPVSPPVAPPMPPLPATQ